MGVARRHPQPRGAFYADVLLKLIFWLVTPSGSNLSRQGPQMAAAAEVAVALPAAAAAGGPPSAQTQLFLSPLWSSKLGLPQAHRQLELWSTIDADVRYWERNLGAAGITKGTISADLEHLRNRMPGAPERFHRFGYRVLVINGVLFAIPTEALADRHGGSFGGWKADVPGWAPHDYGQSDQTMKCLMVVYKALCLNQGLSLRNVEFVLFGLDGANNRPSIMSWSRHNPGQHDLLLPYFSTLEIERFATGFFEPVPWEQRQPVAVWRGSANGCRYAKDTWRQCVRARAVLACLQPGSHCDAGFLRAQARATPEGMADMAAAGVYRDAMPFQAMSRYRYVLVIDGNSATSRLGPLMFSNTTILKQASPITEFFYDSLRPFVHYVPFSNTAEDLLSVIEWVRNNDAAAREIAANAYQWAVTHLTGRSVADYVGTMLNAYGRLQRFEPTLTPDLAPWRVVPVGGFLPAWEATADKGRCGGVRQAA